MAALKHPRSPLHTRGAQSKRPPEERDGRSTTPRKPNAGRKRKDGSDPIPVPEEHRHLIDSGGRLSKALLRGPPTAEEVANFIAKYGECPDDRLTPAERWVQTTTVIEPYDQGLAEEYLDRLANGENIPWMVRNWPAFPGTRTLDAWVHSAEFMELKRVKLERRSESDMMSAEALQRQTFHDVRAGNVSDKLAMPLVSAARYLADGARAAAEKHSRQAYGQHLEVASTVNGTVSVAVQDTALLRELRASLGLGEMKVIEGEVVD
jgi:hypothetical protein